MPVRTFKRPTWAKRGAAFAVRTKARRRAQAQARRRQGKQAGTTRSIRRIERTILNMQEPKFFYDAQWAAAEPANDLGLQKFDMPAQGSGISDREGDRIHADWIKLRGWLIKQADNGTEHVRILVFRWLLDDGITVPTAASVLDLVNWGAGLSLQALYNPNEGHQYRFDILVDKIYTVEHPPGGSVAQMVNIALHIPLDRDIQFLPGVQTGPGMIYIAALTNDTQAARVGPFITLRGMLQFRDV